MAEAASPQNDKISGAIVLGSPKACNTTSKDKSEDPVAHKSYDNVMNAMLTVSTFAAAITFNIILKPNINGEPAPGLLYLSYANALFCSVRQKVEFHRLYLGYLQ
jgi:hypothetical protein